MINLGLECENLEDGQSRWGVGHVVLNFIENYVNMPEWHARIKLHLYFKNKIPNDPVLQNPLLLKKICSPYWLQSFNLYYHILLPFKAQVDQIDVMFFPAYQLPPLYLKKSVVLLTNDVYYEYKKGNLPFRYKLAYRLFTNWAAIKAWKILAISEASKKEVARLYKISADRIFVSKLGVKSNNQASGHHNNLTGPYILYIGQMFPRRHTRELLLAFEKMIPEFPDLKLILVGKDKYSPAIINKLIKSINNRVGLDCIIRYEYVERDSEIHELYKKATLFVYCSDHEAFGLPPVEAASYGVPVVVHDDELNHELFGEAAFFVKNSNNINELARTLRTGLTDTAAREKMISEYKKIILELNWKKFTINILNEIYKNH